MKTHANEHNGDDSLKEKSRTNIVKDEKGDWVKVCDSILGRWWKLSLGYGIQSGPKKFIHSLLINIFGINLNEISISGWECNIMFSQQMAQALL